MGMRLQRTRCARTGGACPDHARSERAATANGAGRRARGGAAHLAGLGPGDELSLLQGPLRARRDDGVWCARCPPPAALGPPAAFGAAQHEPPDRSRASKGPSTARPKRTPSAPGRCCRCWPWGPPATAAAALPASPAAGRPARGEVPSAATVVGASRATRGAAATAPRGRRAARSLPRSAWGTTCIVMKAHARPRGAHWPGAAHLARSLAHRRRGGLRARCIPLLLDRLSPHERPSRALAAARRETFALRHWRPPQPRPAAETECMHRS
jgi:hypothetical protein